MQGMHQQAILGDLNTMAHGVARLSQHYCTDQMRFWSLGQTEAGFWHRNLMLVPDPRYPAEAPSSNTCNTSNPSACTADPSAILRQRAGSDNAMHPCSTNSSQDASSTEETQHQQQGASLEHYQGRPMNMKLLRWGVPEAACQELLNPGEQRICIHTCMSTYVNTCLGALCAPHKALC